MERFKISDLWTKSGKPYEVVYKGFRPGALQYIDRGYTLKSIPPFLEGATLIKTAGSDKMYEEHEPCLSFVVNKTVTVCVLHADKFERKPKWLNAFENTREKVTRTDTSLETMINPLYRHVFQQIRTDRILMPAIRCPGAVTRFLRPLQPVLLHNPGRAILPAFDAFLPQGFRYRCIQNRHNETDI